MDQQTQDKLDQLRREAGEELARKVAAAERQTKRSIGRVYWILGCVAGFAIGRPLGFLLYHWING